MVLKMREKIWLCHECAEPSLVGYDLCASCFQEREAISDEIRMERGRQQIREGKFLPDDKLDDFLDSVFGASD
jgi:protein-arginine kinase activator protein McsA